MIGPAMDHAPVAFGPFELFPQARLLRRSGQRVDIGGRALDLLIALAERPGVVWSKRELIKRIWSDIVVEDGSLRFHMTALRRLLGDGTAGARYISTQVGVGYAFVGSLEPAGPIDAPHPPLDLPPETASRPHAPLPAPLDLIGRDREIELVVQELHRPTLFTITGAAGVGKTALAIEAAHSLSEKGAQPCWVDLAAITEATPLHAALASALGMPAPADDAIPALAAGLNASDTVLILDNCEHIIDAVARLVERLRDEAPDTTILVTSREPLRARGERVLWLTPLACPPESAATPELLSHAAMALFLQRATAGNMGLSLTSQDLHLIADMCRRLGGLPLPIELAAVRVATYGVTATHRLLGEHISLFWAGRRTAPPRHQTLLSALDWSYALLSREERLTFERLSVLEDSFTLDSVHEAASGADLDPAVIPAALDALILKGLIVLDKGRGDLAFRLLEMTRTYARHRLDLSRSASPHPAPHHDRAAYRHTARVFAIGGAHRPMARHAAPD